MPQITMLVANTNACEMRELWRVYCGRRWKSLVLTRGLVKLYSAVFVVVFLCWNLECVWCLGDRLVDLIKIKNEVAKASTRS